MLVIIIMETINFEINISGLLNDPSVLIEGVLFRARYLGSTQLVCEGQPTKSTRMCQAEEAVSRIKVRTQFVLIIFRKLTQKYQKCFNNMSNCFDTSLFRKSRSLLNCNFN